MGVQIIAFRADALVCAGKHAHTTPDRRAQTRQCRTLKDAIKALALASRDPPERMALNTASPPTAPLPLPLPLGLGLGLSPVGLLKKNKSPWCENMRG